MLLGVDYYPEQWAPEMMEPDMDTILEMGCNVIRIGEFAWHMMEKKDGQFDFSFFDGVVAMAKRKGLKVIMGTPTAALPAWLAKMDPDVLSEFDNGRKRTFGGRHLACFNSPTFNRYAERITRKMLEHYKDEDGIVAWQVDNEISHEDSDTCYCPRCHAAFQSFLSDKFGGDIDALNRTYGTTFWSQEYNGFDEIPLPTPTITTHNPALRQDWERFLSRSISGFMKRMCAVVREVKPDAVITHDYSGGGLAKHTDFSVISENIDVVSYNDYPVWGGLREPIAPHEIAFGLDYMRGLKGKNFWITEAILGGQGHDFTGYSPRPGQAIMWSCQGLAHGCDSILYFRYRCATKGAEMLCTGVLDTDNIKRRKFYEVQKFFGEVQQYASAIEAPVESEVAMVYDYDSLASFRIQSQSVLMDVPAEMAKYYKPFYDANVLVDVIPAGRDLSRYKVIILPQLIIGKPDFIAQVKQFVLNGGIAVITYRTSVKDINNNLVFGERIPVGYADFAGVTVAETESLQAGQELPLVGADGSMGEGGTFRDMLEVNGAEVLYRYGDPFYTEFAAVTRKKQGNGQIYYLGCGLDKATTEKIMNGIIADADISCERTEPGVEVVVRGSGNDRVRIIMNHNGYAVVQGAYKLAPYESRIERI